MKGPASDRGAFSMLFRVAFPTNIGADKTHQRQKRRQVRFSRSTENRLSV